VSRFFLQNVDVSEIGDTAGFKVVDYRALEGSLIAWMRHRGRPRLESLAEFDQSLVFFVLPVHRRIPFDGGARNRRAGPVT
jgi:hypothetical protein